MDNVKKIASYIWDIPIEKASSNKNPFLEVVWSNGKKMLHSKNANYSFGSLHEVFKQACKQVEEEIDDASSILILGFGGGSILDILDKHFAYGGSVTGIDYDAKVLELFHKHFAPSIGITPQLHATDAETFLKNSAEVYDVIFVDLFQDLQTDGLLLNPSFSEMLKQHLSSKGVVLLNTIFSTSEDKSPQLDLMLNLSSTFKSVNTINCQNLNTVFIAK